MLILLQLIIMGKQLGFITARKSSNLSSYSQTIIGCQSERVHEAHKQNDKHQQKLQNVEQFLFVQCFGHACSLDATIKWAGLQMFPKPDKQVNDKEWQHEQYKAGL